MPPEFHQRVRDLFDEALDRPAAERADFVRAAAAGEPEVRQAVLELLGAHGESESFLDRAAPSLPKIGRYVVERELGRGGMGIVYEALDPLIGRTVAIKVIRLNAPEDESELLRKQLLGEARSAGQLSHPGIVIVFDVGQESESAFIAMERVEGPTLAQVMEETPRPPIAKVLDMLRQAAQALDYAHQKGVLHRDVKPANIMLHHGAQVKIADFGLAKITSGPQRTSTKMVMGTPAYMSPERITQDPLDGRSDQFSLAVIAFELLTGKRPFPGEFVMEVLRRIKFDVRPSARFIEPSLPAGVDAVLGRGLARSPGDRYATCAQFVAALEEALIRPQPAPAAPPRTPPPRTPLPSTPAPMQAAPTPPRTPPPVQTGPPRTPPPMPPRVLAMPVKTPLPEPPPSTGIPSAVWIVGTGLIVLVAGLLYLQQTPKRPHTPETIPPPIAGQGPPEAAPVIVRFLAEPRAVEEGGSALLSWEVTGASTVSISPDVGDVPAGGSSMVRPGGATTYMLTATGLGGTALAHVSVDVKQKGSMPVAPLPETSRTRSLYDEALAARRAGLPDKSLTLCRQSAEAGYPPAMTLLGDLYIEGKTVRKDYQQAVHWYRKAADARDPVGMYHLGLMYLGGLGVPKDAAQAEAWFRKAAAAGNGAAKLRLAPKK